MGQVLRGLLQQMDQPLRQEQQLQWQHQTHSEGLELSEVEPA